MILTLDEICQLANGNPLTPLSDMTLNTVIEHLITDSRSIAIPDHALFFAIPTATNTGVNFIGDAYGSGVRYFIIPDSISPEDARRLAIRHPDATFIAVADPVKALQQIAGRHNAYGGEVVAITGSKGKTTVKEYICQLLQESRIIARSPRSYNSQIGVPLSMWNINPDTQLTLIEAGVSQADEMSRLAECIRPDTVIITDMTREHDGGFRSHAEKVKEKVSLAASPGVARVIYCSDQPDVAAEINLLRQLPANREFISWSLLPQNDSDSTPDLLIEKVNSPESADQAIADYSEIIYRFSNDTPQRLRIPLTEEADLRNAYYALTFLLASGFTDNARLNLLFSRLHPITTRLSVSDGRSRGSNIIYDAFTVDFTSAVPAIDFMMRRLVPGQHATVIMSQWRPALGDRNQQYRQLAHYLSDCGVDTFIGVGEEWEKYADDFNIVTEFFPSTDLLLEYLRRNPDENDLVLLMGSPEYDFASAKEVLEERTHQTTLEVNLDAIIKNYNYFKSHLPASTGMIAMVKASGYGAGSYEIAKTLQDAGAAYLAVAVLDEGIALRKKGIEMPIMVMNPRVADYRDMFLFSLEPEIYSLQMLRDVIGQAEKYNVMNYPLHLKIDTGMHRMGFIEEELPEVLDILGNQNRVKISTAFSHLATADCPDLNDYTEMQVSTFERASRYLLDNCGYHFKRHILNSAGILRFPQFHYDFARLGIGLYGVNTLPPEMEKPLAVVSSLRTVIINLRDYNAGESIGYARKGMLGRDSRIATIPIGYADGMSRAFGNGRISVIVNGKQAPTIGNICMDACMIDVTDIDCRVGDTVEIFGDNAPITRLSEAIDTIPYEILTSVSPRVKRIYFRE